MFEMVVAGTAMAPIRRRATASGRRKGRGLVGVARHNAAQGKVAPAATDHVTVVGGSRISIQGDKLQDIFRTVADRRLANNRRSRALPLSQPAARKDCADGTISAMAGWLWRG
jgi:hypothetical protein